MIILELDEECVRSSSNLNPPVSPGCRTMRRLSTVLCCENKIKIEMIDKDEMIVEGKSVLELGAGAGLPSLICALVRKIITKRKNRVEHFDDSE